MTVDEFAKVASALAWPLTALAFLLVYLGPARKLLERLASTLTIKSVKLKAFGAEVELTPEQAKRALDELLQDVADLTNGLTSDELALFEIMNKAGGKKTVGDIFPTFERNSREHGQLQKLRDRKLVRPVEGGSWLKNKHPITTRFGQIVYNLRNAPKGDA